MNHTHVFLIFWVVVLAVYMLVAAMLHGAGVWSREETVSGALEMACKRYPILPFVLGSIIYGLFAHVLWGDK